MEETGIYTEHTLKPYDFMRPLLSIVAVGTLLMVSLLIFLTSLSPPNTVLVGLLMGLGGGILWVLWEISRFIKKM